MRLIDADSIKFTEYINGDITVSKEAIEKMPTSYDVDKVAEKIKKIMENESIRFVDQAVNRSVNIVKSGGIE